MIYVFPNFHRCKARIRVDSANEVAVLVNEHCHQQMFENSEGSMKDYKGWLLFFLHELLSLSLPCSHFLFLFL